MILTEYDEQEEREYQRAEGREEGRAEGREEGRELGLAEGLAEGRVRTLLTQIQKKHAKGKSLPQIAEELEEDIIYRRGSKKGKKDTKSRICSSTMVILSN